MRTTTMDRYSGSRHGVTSFHDELRAFSAVIRGELEQRELSFPTVLDLSLRIRSVANDPDSSVADLAKLIRIEPVLSARVIRLANSVIYNRAGRNISNIAEAIPRIGISNVRVLALIVAMDQLAQEHRSRAMRELARDAWHHSLDVASWAYAFAKHVGVASADTALLVGLMTDVGQLFLIARAGDYPAVANDLVAFTEVAEVWSDALTRAILGKMDMPPDIVDAFDLDDGYEGRWPPTALHELLYVAALASKSDRPLDRLDATVRVTQRDALRAKVGAAYDDLIEAAAPARDELLAVLTTP